MASTSKINLYKLKYRIVYCSGNFSPLIFQFQARTPNTQ